MTELNYNIASNKQVKTKQQVSDHGEKTHQFLLFNDESNAADIDEPIKDFPLIHYLKLDEDE